MTLPKVQPQPTTTIPTVPGGAQPVGQQPSTTPASGPPPSADPSIIAGDGGGFADALKYATPGTLDRDGTIRAANMLADMPLECGPSDQSAACGVIQNARAFRANNPAYNFGIQQARTDAAYRGAQYYGGQGYQTLQPTNPDPGQQTFRPSPNGTGLMARNTQPPAPPAKPSTPSPSGTSAEVAPKPTPAEATPKPAAAKTAAAPKTVPVVRREPVAAKTAAEVKLGDTELAKAIGQFKGPPSKSVTSYGSSGDGVGALQAGLIQASMLDGSSRFQKNDSKYGNATQTGVDTLRASLAKATGLDAGAAGTVPDQKFMVALESYQKLIEKEPAKADPALNQFIKGIADYQASGNAMTDAAASPGAGKNDKVNMGGDNTPSPAPSGKKTEPQLADTKAEKVKADNQPLSEQNNGLPAGVDAADWAKVGSTLTGASQAIVKSLGEDIGAGEISNEGKMAIVLALKARPETAASLTKMLATKGFSPAGGASQVSAVKLFTSDAFMKDPNETVIKKEGRVDALRGVMAAQTPGQVKMMIDLASSAGFANVSGGSHDEVGIRDAYVKGASKAVVENLQDVKPGAAMPWAAYKSELTQIGEPAVRAMAFSRIQDDRPGSKNEGAASQIYDTTRLSGFSSAPAIVQLSLVAGAGKSTFPFDRLGKGPLNEAQAAILGSPKFALLSDGDRAMLAAAVSANQDNDLKLKQVLLPALNVMASRTFQAMDPKVKGEAFKTLSFAADEQEVREFALKIQGGLPKDYKGTDYEQMGALSTAQVAENEKARSSPYHGP